jgi:soluble lytic murein transglycosylase-like protein
MTVKKKIMPARNGISTILPMNMDNETPLDIPSQNTKFQKLSLLILALGKLGCALVDIQFLKFHLDTNIVLTQSYLRKLFTKFSLYLLLILISQASFALEVPQLIREVEAKYNIPNGLLTAIAEVESGLKPYAIGVEGRSLKAFSKAEAKKIINDYLVKGRTNIDIGIMQINWHWHAKEFAGDLDVMLSPQQNIEYAAKLLISLYRKYNSWQKAVRYYHSAKDEYHRKYSKAVLVSWLRQN